MAHDASTKALRIATNLLATCSLGLVAAFAACSTEGAARNDHPSAERDPSARDANDGAHEHADASTTTDGSVDAAPAPLGPLFLFVGSGDGKIRVYDVEPSSGALSFKKESNAGKNPSFLAFDPSRRRVVAVDEIGKMGQVRSFTFDPATGALAEIDAAPAGGAGSTHLSFDPSGHWVMVANYTGGNMSIRGIDANGTFGAATTKTSGANSHWAGTNPSGTDVFVPALGANVIAQYRLAGATGALADNGEATVPAGAGPRHLAFHPSEKWAYVINEVSTAVTAFDFDVDSGKLAQKDTVSALPKDQSKAGVTGAEIFVHPSGDHVYASTRGYDSIAHFTVNATNGALTLVANTLTGGDQPRSFGMDPQGTLLYAGNQSQDRVVGFRIATGTGALEPLGTPLDVPRPTFVGLTRMP